jgi:hypothetical protein
METLTMLRLLWVGGLLLLTALAVGLGWLLDGVPTGARVPAPR